MTRSIFLSLVFHSAMIVITAITLPFMTRAPIDLPPILSVDLIQITDKTSIPFAAKAAKTLEEIKKNEPLIIKKNTKGIRITELSTRLIISCFITHYQSFF